MITIVEPKGYIVKLWGNQPIKKDSVYRLMRYVIRTEYEGTVLLHNTVTGHLVALDRNESSVLERLPLSFNPVIEQLILNHFLVPVQYDEHHQVQKLRRILQTLEDVQSTKSILHYTILPTTACNARCYYCFEQGVETSTMSEQTATDVIEYISSHCGNEKTIVITWFGGEPTIATNRIDQICEGLQKNNIKYRSKMYTNGYLLDLDMIKKAKELWHLIGVQVCVDGTENSYNRIKAYISTTENPYQRVMRNIGWLLDQGIAVGLRMNFDLGNYQEFSSIVDEVENRFGHNELLYVSAHPVIGEYEDHDGNVMHADDDWFSTKVVELNRLSRDKGLRQSKSGLPFLNGDACSASHGTSITIRPDGGISRCAELFGNDDLVGTIHSDIIYYDRDCSWKLVADYNMCVECVFYPFCVRLINCPNKTYCHKKLSYEEHYREVIKKVYSTQKSANKKEDFLC